jgi:hypothetical protein
MPQKKQQPSGWGCLAALVVAVIVIIGVIVNACSGPGTPADQPLPPAPPVATSVSSPGPAPAAAVPSPTPTRHHRKRRHRHRHAPPPATVPPPQPACYPLTNGGNCYEPGEFCRQSDAGAYGVAGDGEKIRCEDNNGLRWEPV